MRLLILLGLGLLCTLGAAQPKEQPKENDPSRLPASTFDGLVFTGSLGLGSKLHKDEVALLTAGDGYGCALRGGKLLLIPPGKTEADAIAIQLAGGQKVGDMVKFDAEKAKTVFPGAAKGVDTTATVAGSLREKLTMITASITLIQGGKHQTFQFDGRKPEPKPKEKPAAPDAK